MGEEKDGGKKKMKMSNGKGMKISIAIVCISVLALSTVGVLVGSSHTIYVNPDESIQAAIDNASDGDTIIVRDGTYTENVDVNKRLTIMSENGSSTTKVIAADSNDSVFEVTADHVSISGFTITGGNYGIYVFGNANEIYNNTIKYNDNYGIYLDNTCSNTIIYNNTFIDNNVKFSAHTSQGYDTGTNNHWNSTDADKDYIGNYWDDWQNNSGFPGSYEIDGNSNKDKRPKGLYDFLTGASEDKWAYRWQINQTEFDSGSPIYPNTELTTDPDEYAKIKVDDEDPKYDYTNGNGNYSAHRFNFSISENTSKITKINVTWNGKGWHDRVPPNDNGSTLYIWNFSSASYDQLATTTSGDEVTLTGEKTTSISSYINAGNMTILVKQNTAQEKVGQKTYYSHIETDYVRVVICATP